jgi:SpoU rRNA methylase family enzyme
MNVYKELAMQILQEAKNRFRAMVNAAVSGSAQVVEPPNQRLSQVLYLPELDDAETALFSRNRESSPARELTL